MALGNYNDLQAAIADWLNRLDAADDVVARVPDFITLAETKFFPRLVSRRLIKDADGSAIPADGEVPTPTDLVEPRIVVLQDKDDNDMRELYSYTEAQQMQDDVVRTRTYSGSGSASGGPVSYAIEGDVILFSPWGDADVENGYKVRIRYFYSPLPLSDAHPANNALTYHPGVYLYASLAEAAPYLEDEQAIRCQMWIAKVEDELSAARRDANRGLHGVMQASPPM